MLVKLSQNDELNKEDSADSDSKQIENDLFVSKQQEERIRVHV